MAWEEVAEGSVLDLPFIDQYEDELAEGSNNLIELDLRLPVSAGVAEELEDILRDLGVEGVRVTTASPMLRIYFSKGFPWLAVIAAALIGSIVLAALIVAWRLFTEVPSALPVALILGVGLLTIAGVYLVTRRRL